MTATDTHRAIDAVWRIEQARLIAGLTRMVRDVGIAEDLARTIHAHPTMSEAVKEAALAVSKSALHAL